LSGAPLEGWQAVNITSDAHYGIGAWSDAEIATYLVEGHADGRGSAAGPMGEAVENSLQYLEQDDAQAIVAYLRTVPARSGANLIEIEHHPEAASDSTSAAPAITVPDTKGLALFTGACASCHAYDGSGRQSRYASLVGSSSVNDPAGASVIQVILHGVDMHIHGQAVFMPAFGNAYSDAEIAALANYVIGQYGEKSGQVSAKTVARQRIVE
jgi:mono/diheme cytochrome c family protein